MTVPGKPVGRRPGQGSKIEGATPPSDSLKGPGMFVDAGPPASEQFPEEEPEELAPGPPEVDYLGKLAALVRAFLENEKQIARVRLWSAARIAALGNQSAWLEDSIRPLAIQAREESGSAELPISGGRVRVQARPAKQVLDVPQLRKWAEKRILEITEKDGDIPMVEIEEVAEIRGCFEEREPKFNARRLVSRLFDLTGQRDSYGVVAGTHKGTGEELAGIVEKHYAGKGDYSVSIKPGTSEADFLDPADEEKGEA